MRLKFFHIPMVDPLAAEAELNQFLASHRVLEVQRHFVATGLDSGWAVCVAFVEGVAGSHDAGARKGKIDYREVLAEDEFAVYSRLRSLRKELAERDAVPAYALFTNEQLAAMVRQRVDSATSLAALEGVGQARVAKYGAPFLEVLRAARWVRGDAAPS